MQKPNILFVPGLWEGPNVFTHISALLQAQGYLTQTATLPSTGTTSPGNPSMADDEAAIHTVVKKLVEEEGKSVVLVCHSAGGFLGSAAISGLSSKARNSKGETGGIGKIVFLTAGLGPEGHVHAPLPFMDFSRGNGEMHPISPAETMFHDLEEGEKEKWMKGMKCQPSEGWDGTTTYCGWREVESVYLVCEGDRILPVKVQEMMAEMAGSRIVRCASGHMVMLAMPEKVVEVVIEAAEGL